MGGETVIGISNEKAGAGICRREIVKNPLKIGDGNDGLTVGAKDALTRADAGNGGGRTWLNFSYDLTVLWVDLDS